MRIVKPEVVLVYPVLHEEAQRDMELIELAARTCYNSEDKIEPGSYDGMIRRLIKAGHTAPIEFGRAVFRITCSRAVMAELTRHRHASFCVQSQRYVRNDKYGDIAFIMPDGLDDEAKEEWHAAMMWAEGTYKGLIDGGKSPQDARTVLPNSCATTMIVGANLREWRHIVSLRASKRAYPEMQEVARMILDQLRLYYDCVFDDLVAEGESNAEPS